MEHLTIAPSSGQFPLRLGGLCLQASFALRLRRPRTRPARLAHVSEYKRLRVCVCQEIISLTFPVDVRFSIRGANSSRRNGIDELSFPAASGCSSANGRTVVDARTAGGNVAFACCTAGGLVVSFEAV